MFQHGQAFHFSWKQPTGHSPIHASIWWSAAPAHSHFLLCSSFWPFPRFHLPQFIMLLGQFAFFRYILIRCTQQRLRREQIKTHQTTRLGATVFLAQSSLPNAARHIGYFQSSSVFWLTSWGTFWMSLRLCSAFPGFPSDRIAPWTQTPMYTATGKLRTLTGFPNRRVCRSFRQS